MGLWAPSRVGPPLNRGVCGLGCYATMAKRFVSELWKTTKTASLEEKGMGGQMLDVIFH